MRIGRLLFSLVVLSGSRAEDLKPVFPATDWERVSSAEAMGFSSAKLEVLRAWMKTQSTTAMMVSVGGRVLFEYGDLTNPSLLASVRKSVLGMLYGKHLDMQTGPATLSKTVKELGLDDVQ